MMDSESTSSLFLMSCAPANISAKTRTSPDTSWLPPQEGELPGGGVVTYLRDDADCQTTLQGWKSHSSVAQTCPRVTLRSHGFVGWWLRRGICQAPRSPELGAIRTAMGMTELSTGSQLSDPHFKACCVFPWSCRTLGLAHKSARSF